MIERVARRGRLMSGRAVLNLVNDAAGLQTLQVSALADETRDDVERVQNYGMSSVPLNGATVIMVAVAGVRDHLVAVAVDDPRYRPQNLQPGEVCIYTDEGDKIHFKRGNIIEVTTKQYIVNTEQYIVKASEKVRFETPLVQATDEIIDKADTNTRSVSQMREQHNKHKHDKVQPGSGTSGTTTDGM